jgi:hypothetical protein
MTFGLPSSTCAGQVLIRAKSSTLPPSSQPQSGGHPEGVRAGFKVLLWRRPSDEVANRD